VAVNEPIDPRVRLARGAVSTFCVEHGIPRKSFIELSEEVKAQAVAVRAALEASGLDHGPKAGRFLLVVTPIDLGLYDRVPGLTGESFRELLSSVAGISYCYVPALGYAVPPGRWQLHLALSPCSWPHDPRRELLTPPLDFTITD
jgi:hypothetical protein